MRNALVNLPTGPEPRVGANDTRSVVGQGPHCVGNPPLRGHVMTTGGEKDVDCC